MKADNGSFKLSELAKENKTWKEVFKFLAERQRNRGRMDLHQLQYGMKEKNRELKIDRKTMTDLFQRLEECGLGKLEDWNRNTPPRFTFNFTARSIGEAALNPKTAKLQPIGDLEIVDHAGKRHVSLKKSMGSARVDYKTASDLLTAEAASEELTSRETTKYAASTSNTSPKSAPATGFSTRVYKFASGIKIKVTLPNSASASDINEAFAEMMEDLTDAD